LRGPKTRLGSGRIEVMNTCSRHSNTAIDVALFDERYG
jgi:hypothetical protein